jgi:ferredoxin, 2Fe-2S
MSQTITVNFIAPSGVTTTLNGKIGKSLMDVAASKNLDGIAADCGGLMTCATCHVFVHQSFAALLAPPNTEEQAMLAFTAVPREPNSRLSCQIILSEALNELTVTLPASQY